MATRTIPVRIKLVLAKLWYSFANWITKGLKEKKLAMAGFLLTWVMPLITILSFFANQKPTTQKVYPIWLILTAAVVLVIYVRKGKQMLRDRVLVAKVRGVPICPLYYIINGLISVLSIALVYWTVDYLTSIKLAELQRYLIVCMASVGSGALCTAAYAVNQLQPDQLDSEGHQNDHHRAK